MKPLFIPLLRQWFEAFERGEKTHEWRRYGARWNEGTIHIGKRAILSLGYSGRRLEARVVGFERHPAPPHFDMFEPGADCIVIELADIRPINPPPRGAPTLRREMMAQSEYELTIEDIREIVVVSGLAHARDCIANTESQLGSEYTKPLWTEFQKLEDAAYSEDES